MDQGRQAWQPQALLRTLHNIENWDYVLHWIVGCFCVHSPVLHCVGLCPLCMAIRAQGNLSMNAAWISESSWTTFRATWYSISLASYNFKIQTYWKWPRSFHLPGTFTPQEYFPSGWLPNLSPASSPSMLLMWWNIFIFCCICVTRWSFLATNCFWCYNLLKEQDRSPLLKAQQLPGDLFSGIKKGFETFHLNFNVIFILKSPNAAKTTKLCNPFWKRKFERNLVWNIFLQFISSQLQTAIIS